MDSISGGYGFCKFPSFSRWFEEATHQLEGTPHPGAHTPPPWYDKEGPMPTISDSLFSLIILVYVSVIFVFMFFSFCWKARWAAFEFGAHGFWKCLAWLASCNCGPGHPSNKRPF